MNVDMAKRLADRRRQAGLTQEGLAEKLDVTRQAVSKWERSESSPDTDNLIALAQLYGVSLDELLYEDVNTKSCEEVFEAEIVDVNNNIPTSNNDSKPDKNNFGEGVSNNSVENENEVATKTTCSDQAENKNQAESNNESDAQNSGTEDSASTDQNGDRNKNADNYSTDHDSNQEKTTGNRGFGLHSDDGNLHMGPDGIHVEDGKDYVHINWRDGVNVIDGNKGDQVHVGWDGVHVNDHYFDNLQDANEFLGTKKAKSGFAKAWVRFPFPLLVIIAYILVGVFQGAWGLGLFLFALIPVYYLIGSLINTKCPGPFFAGLYPLGSICYFCYMAFVLNQPHPAWVIFLTIPLVEWFIFAISHWWRKRKKNAAN